MKKNLLIAILLGTTLLSLAFGYQQRSLAEKFRLEALESKVIAEQQRIIAEHQSIIAQENRILAMVNQEEALKQRKLAEKALERKK